MQEGNVENAAELFEDPAWKGAANYRAGNFDEAITQLENIEGIENKYNLGNALARKGMYEQAIALYDEVLEVDPDHGDAKHNKELLEQELQDQQQQQQQQQPQQSFSDQNQQQQDQEQQQQDQSQDQQNQDQAQQQQDQQDQGQDQEQQMQETEQQAEQAEEQQPDEQQDPGRMDPMQANLDQPDEEEQATEQWLRRIPDDPGGLLRRKFLLQYQQRQRERIPGEKQW
ncbi:MAG: tetratricopeptide repeat protein [Gammaproteobacteria bacterium]|nr:tetratricopeptide repeat protein [Gammaproteobacteria bacterium]